MSEYTPDTLRGIAQNDYMIDHGMLETGHDLIACADTWGALVSRIYEVCGDATSGREHLDPFQCLNHISGENGRLRKRLEQARGALGYPVSGDVPEGDFVNGIADALSKRLEAKERLLDEVNERLAALEPKLDRIQRNSDLIIEQRDDFRKRLVEAEKLLGRLYRWDHMDTAADGTYWRSEIAAALAAGESE